MEQTTDKELEYSPVLQGDFFTLDCESLHLLFFFSSRRRHTRSKRDWSSDVCSSDLARQLRRPGAERQHDFLGRVITARGRRRGDAALLAAEAAHLRALVDCAAAGEYHAREFGDVALRPQPCVARMEVRADHGVVERRFLGPRLSAVERFHGQAQLAPQRHLAFSPLESARISVHGEMPGLDELAVEPVFADQLGEPGARGLEQFALELRRAAVVAFVAVLSEGEQPAQQRGVERRLDAQRCVGLEQPFERALDRARRGQRQQAGRDGAAAADGIPVQHGHAAARAQEVACAGQPDRATAQNQHVAGFFHLRHCAGRGRCRKPPGSFVGVMNLDRTRSRKMNAMDRPRIVSRNEWIEEHKKLLAKEKELTRLRDALAAERRTLPWGRVDKNYVFDSPQGKRTLAELFDGRSQLFVKHFMLGPGQTTQCVGCSLEVDHVEGLLEHLWNNDVSYVAVARAPLGEIEAARRRMGWRFPWVSSYGTDFNYDFNVSFKPQDLAAGRAVYNFQRLPEWAGGIEDLSGDSVFSKDADGRIYHTYSTDGRGGEQCLGIYGILDMLPKGRNENGPYHSLTDWARPRNMYGKGGTVEANGRYHTPSCCLVHR